MAELAWIRPLGKGEWYNWLIDKGNCTNFTVAAEVEGAVDWERFRKTLGATHERHPILGTRIRVRGRRAFLVNDPGQSPELSMDLRDDPDPDSWRPIAEAELDRPIDVGSEPPARTFVLRHGPDHASILMTFAHAFADGKSAALLLLETLRLATTNAPAPAARPVVAAMESGFPANHRGFRGQVERARFVGRLASDSVRWGFPKRLSWMRPNAEHTRNTGLLHLCVDENHTPEVAWQRIPAKYRQFVKDHEIRVFTGVFGKFLVGNQRRVGYNAWGLAPSVALTLGIPAHEIGAMARGAIGLTRPPVTPDIHHFKSNNHSVEVISHAKNRIHQYGEACKCRSQQSSGG